jgi:hypothetical protein
VFENSVLRKIFRLKRDEMSEEWRKLHNEELRDFYSSPSIIRIIKKKRIRWSGHFTQLREKRLLVGKPEGKRQLGRSRRRWCIIHVLGWILERWDGVMRTGFV